MKYIKTYKLFESTQTLTPEQVEWLDMCTNFPRSAGTIPSTWSFDSQGRVDVDRDFNSTGFIAMSGKPLNDLKGVRFGKIGGSFMIGRNNITSLKGSPYEVDCMFICEDNALESLEGAPQKVGGHFMCKNNPSLTSLKGAPQIFGYTDKPGYDRNNRPGFSCIGCALSDLEGSPKYVPGDFDCSGNPLKSLKGGPQEVGGSYICRTTTIESLEGAPKRVGGAFICSLFRVYNGEWGTPKSFLKLLEGHGDCLIEPHDLKTVRSLILPLMNEDQLDAYMKENPLDLDLLDEFPDIKAGVLQRTGINDISSLARSMRRGLI